MSICQRSVISLGTLSPIKSTNKQVQLLQMSFRQPLHDLTRQKEKMCCACTAYQHQSHKLDPAVDRESKQNQWKYKFKLQSMRF